MGFNPDKYLAKKNSSSSNGFDPDRYLASKNPPASSDDSSIMDYLKPIGHMAEDAMFGDPFGVRRVLTHQTPEGPVEAAQRGIVQGGTLGFSDELAGAANALKEGITGGDLGEGYIQGRDLERQNQGIAHSEHPNLYGGGELVGGMAVPGIGAGAKVWQGTKSLPFLSRLAARTATGAGEMGALGGAAGAGYSEGTTPEEVGMDAAKTAGISALLGGLIPGAATAGGALKDWASGQLGNKLSKIPLETVQTARQAYNKGTEGTILNKDTHLKELGGLANTTNEYLTQGLQDLRGQYDNLLEQAKQQGITVDITDSAAQIESKLKDILSNAKDSNVISDAQQMMEKLQEFKSSESLTPPSLLGQQEQTLLSPYQAKQMQQGFGDMASPMRSTLETTEGRIAAGDAKSTLNQDINEIPFLKDTNTKYANLMNAFDQLGIKPNELTRDLNGNLNPDVTGKLVRIMENAEKDSTTQIKTAEQLQNAITSLKTIDPLNAQALESEVARISQNLDLSKKVGGPGFNRLLSPSKAIGTAANFAGYGQYKLSPTLQKLPALAERMNASTIEKSQQPEQVSKNAYQMDNSQLDGLTQQLMANPTLQADGAALQKAIASGNSVSKNAILFNLLQKKEGREVLRAMSQ